MTTANNDITIDDIARLQAERRLCLDFTGNIEAVYQAEKLEDHYEFVSICWAIGLVLYDSFLVSDYFVSRDYFWYYFVARIGVSTPICVIAIYLMSKKHPLYNIFNSLIPLIFTVSLSVLLVITKGDYRSSYLFGDILLMMCGCVIGRPLLAQAIATVSIQFLCYILVLINSDVIPPQAQIVSALFCLSGGTVALMTSYALEKTSRKAFLLGLRVRLLNQKLEVMAMSDPLTGLANRRSLQEAAQRFWARSKDGTQVSLVLIDVDFFKRFNDNYGHPAGDMCLTKIAECVMALVSEETGLAVRFGGEEFAVFLPDTDFTAARLLADSVRRGIESLKIPHPVIAENAVVTASLGVATAPASACTLAELVVRADLALYSAKHNGRNQTWPPIPSLESGARLREDGRDAA